ncbi:MAG: hypothetical protein DYG94_11390 [Leptolyngbya sp. PLA3]|nr:hypothetical protein [Leptolyngbya sp. PL-A3]
MSLGKGVRMLVVFGCLSGASTLCSAQTGGIFDLSWNTMDGGGETYLTGGVFSLGGTIGQPDAGATMAGGVYTLQGGFWPGAAAAGPCSIADFSPPYGALNFFDVQTFLARFSAHDASADLTGDGVWNFFDVQLFLNAFSAGCP